jgi:hypothetical protein
MDHYPSSGCCLIEHDPIVNGGAVALAEPALALYVDLVRDIRLAEHLGRYQASGVTKMSRI